MRALLKAANMLRDDDLDRARQARIRTNAVHDDMHEGSPAARQIPVPHAATREIASIRIRNFKAIGDLELRLQSRRVEC